jgi:acetylxylan esterase
MKIPALASLLLGSMAAASPFDLIDRQLSCPQIHILGARETTASPGFGSSQTVVNLVMNAFPGSTSEAIIYPAAGGTSYASSVGTGVQSVLNQTRAFATRCPNTKLVLVGYSQGSQIMDDAFCGGPDGQSLMSSTVPIPRDVGAKVAAMIWMGNPRFVAGLPYNVGTARLGGVSPPVDRGDWNITNNRDSSPHGPLASSARGSRASSSRTAMRLTPSAQRGTVP